MEEPPRPPWDAPEDSILVIPTDGRPLYRLLKTTEGRATRDDFQPRFGKGKAVQLGIPELDRMALSHYLTLEQAQLFNTQGSRVARVTLGAQVGHFARTGLADGHLDVWARVEDFVPAAEIEE